MTLYKFNKLRENEQFDMLLKDGIIVAKRKEIYYDYVLYQLAKIYVELKYHKDHRRMPDIRAFTSSGNALIPYLETVDISFLLSAE